MVFKIIKLIGRYGNATPEYLLMSVSGKLEPYFALIALINSLAISPAPLPVRCTPSREKVPPVTNSAVYFTLFQRIPDVEDSSTIFECASTKARP